MDPRIAACMFVILKAVADLGTGIGLVLIGLLAESFGIRVTFVINADHNLLALPLVAIIFPKKEFQVVPA